MAFSDALFGAGEPIWTAQGEHPSVRKPAAGTSGDATSLHWVKQDEREAMEGAVSTSARLEAAFREI